MFKFGFLSNAMQLKCFIMFSILICGRQLYTKKEKKNTTASTPRILKIPELFSAISSQSSITSNIHKTIRLLLIIVIAFDVVP